MLARHLSYCAPYSGSNIAATRFWYSNPISTTATAQTILKHINRLSFPCFAMNHWDQALDKYNFKPYNYHTVFLDEVQFMDTNQTVEIVSQMLIDGVNVVAAGLDQDSRGIPFETTAMLLALSDEVTKIQAICTVTGKPATKTQRLVDDGDRVAVGSVGMYEPRCLEHWTPR
jgi:thymidine kinase